MKTVKALKNRSGGFDLLAERDKGNEVRILTGKRENSKGFWEQIKRIADAALVEMDSCVDPDDMSDEIS